MTHFTKLAAALTGLAAIAAVSSPATAQVNPYGQVAPYSGTSNGGIVGAIVGAVTGYGQYPQGNYGYERTSQRGAVEMCARTAEQRLNGDRGYVGNSNNHGRNAYGQNGYSDGGTFRVVGITNVERRTNGALRVRGIASSNVARAGTGWSAHGGHGQYDNGNYAGVDYRFTCKIDSRGAVTSLNLDRGTRSMRG
jgi:hypothetical protein